MSLQLNHRLHRLEVERRAMDHERMQQYAQAVALAQLRQNMPGAHPDSRAAQLDVSQVVSFFGLWDFIARMYL